MAHSGRERHRDRDFGRRDAAEPPTPSPFRAFRITEVQRQDMAKSLRHIDAARDAIEQQHNPDNREILRELRASADRIFEVLNGLEEVEP